MTQHATTYDPGFQVGPNDDVLCLHRNENLFVDQKWLSSLAEEILCDTPIAAYPHPTAMPLREAIARQYGVDVTNVFVGNGSDEVLSDLMELLRHRFDAMYTTDVCFPVYDMLASRFRYQCQTLEGDTFQTGKISFQHAQGLIVVDSPNAITGHHWTWDTLRALAEREDAFLIWDNAYGEFSSDEVPRDLPKNVAVVRSFSKFYALAGLRAGYCIADSQLISELLDRKDAFNVNAFAQRMACATLKHHTRFCEFADDLISCRQILAERLIGFQFDIHQSGGLHLLVSHRSVPAKQLREQLLERNIAVRQFAAALTENYLRVTVPPRSGIDRLCDALSEILQMDTAIPSQLQNTTCESALTTPEDF